MKLTIVESDERYQILGDGALLGFVPEESDFPLGIELVVKNATRDGNTLNVVVGEEGVDEFNYSVELTLPGVMPPSSNGQADKGDKGKADAGAKGTDAGKGGKASEQKNSEEEAPNARVALLIERRKRGQQTNRKMSIVEQRRLSSTDRMKILIESRRKDNI